MNYERLYREPTHTRPDTVSEPQPHVCRACGKPFTAGYGGVTYQYGQPAHRCACGAVLATQIERNA